MQRSSTFSQKKFSTVHSLFLSPTSYKITSLLFIDKCRTGFEKEVTKLVSNLMLLNPLILKDFAQFSISEDGAYLIELLSNCNL